MKKILGLDLGTNSIGWALIDQDFDNKSGRIIDCGSRIIPMSQDVLGKFDSGQSVSQTAERTGYRSVRRLRQRHLLRRERLHRVLNLLGFLPEHYASAIDFEVGKGKFKDDREEKITYYRNAEGRFEFLFQESFREMLEDFKKNQPGILQSNHGIPYDWTLYYLRNKALRRKISKGELAWIILNFNQKRGYYQLRGEEEDEKEGKLKEFIAIMVQNVEKIEEENSRGEATYKITLGNGWSFNKPSKNPVDWEGKTREFIVTTDVDENGNAKTDKEGNVKRTFRSVDSEKDWIAIKKKTENLIEDYETVGTFIYTELLKNPGQKIRGKLIRTIERKYYKEELKKILYSQKQFHPELTDDKLYIQCLEELYPNNVSHKSNIRQKGFEYLFIEDIIFYQRPLKSKKSLIEDCKFERRSFFRNGEKEIVPIKCTPRSNPFFQEFRIWEFLSNLRILEREFYDDGKLKHDVDRTSDFIGNEESREALFDFLYERKEVSQKILLKHLNLKESDFRWNYVEDKNYPCNETRWLLQSRLSKLTDFNSIEFLSFENMYRLWHIVYSIKDKKEYEKALRTFARKQSLPEEEFLELFSRIPPFEADYSAYSEKALKKLLPLMRLGKHWSLESIHADTLDRIQKIVDGEVDETIGIKAREKLYKISNLNDFRGLPLWLASYIVYDRHSEVSELRYWKSPEDINNFFINDFRQHMLRNPIVEQIVTETLRVVRDIWQYHGKGKEKFFDEIHVELGREMKNPAEKRRNITLKNIENENTNQRIRELLVELKNEGVDGVRPFSPNQQEILKIYEEGVFLSNGNTNDEIIKIRRNSQPTQSEIKRYKLWLEQGYISPYTGKTIQLSRLFTTDYQIEHVIPQSRFFDDSLSNKVICESEVNEWKGHMTAMEFISKHGGEMVRLSNGQNVAILKQDEYQEHVKKYFKGNQVKQKKLLTEEIPESFIERQMNDSRYISKVVKSLLSNIVREEGEMEATSKNLITINGAITSQMKKDWGLNEVWNSIIFPRFERLNEMTSSTDFGYWANKNGKRYFQTDVPAELKRGFNRKRIDHRHHTLDAIIIASTTREHVNYITSLNSERGNYSLINRLRKTEKYNGRDIPKDYHLPWAGYNREVKESLERVIVSFKQNLRIINKTVNRYEKWVSSDNGQMKKKLVSQVKGDNWAIRKPLHKETVYGRVSLKRIKPTPVSLNVAIDNYEWLVDKRVKTIISEKMKELGDPKKVKKHFKENPINNEAGPITSFQLYEEFSATASRVSLDESFTKKKILSITDTGIQKIVIKHLERYDTVNSKGMIQEHPELAFSQEGLESLNENIIELNEGKPHQPIYKVRIFEEGNRFAVGFKGNKKDKFVEAAKGTNLFFAVYQNEEGTRKYNSIPLFQAIERQKQGLKIAEDSIWDEKSGDEFRLLFVLSPNDLVYVPEEGEDNMKFPLIGNEITAEQVNRIYKMVSCQDSDAHFIKSTISKPIWNSFEFTRHNKTSRTIEGEMIKEKCKKIYIDRIGRIVN